MPTLTLPEELTIYAVGELRPQWLAWLDAAAAGGEAPPVQAAAVTEVDGAGLQMLLALRHALAGRGLALRLETASTALCEAALAAGLDRALGLAGEAA